MTRVGPETGVCLACGTVAPLVNYGPPRNGLPAEGYLARHHRPGTRRGTSCRGSFGGWAEVTA